MNKKMDLHIHTNLSDGILSPKEVIDMAVNNGVSVISITDHDTILAYDDELFNYASDRNITIINGVEISTKLDKIGIHILGYGFDINNQELIKKLAKIRNARHDYLNNVSLKLRELGFIVNTDNLSKIDVVTKAHIALDVINNEKNKELLFKTFNHIPSKGEFIETLMNEGCPAYVKKETVTPIEAAKLIRSAGGKVVLAHPVSYKYEDNLSDEDILNIIFDIKADGIEANYIYIDCNNNKINESDIWNEIAIDNDLTTTIGSDFHNDDGIHPKIGLIGEDLNIGNNSLFN